MLNGRCVAECPQESFYRGKSGRHEACIPCYYTCKTCSGSNDYEVRHNAVQGDPEDLRLGFGT